MKCCDQKYKGLFVKMITNPALYLMAKNAGLDFVFYDNEHSVFTKTQLHDLMLFGNNIGIPSFVRVCDLTRKEVSQMLDCGAKGIMVPMIETRQQAELLVALSKYPPIGNRGYSGGANTNYAPSGGHRVNMQRLNETVVTIAQIETKLGIDNAQDIISTPGIDAIIVGPADLSISLGNVDNVMAEQELVAINKVAQLCRKYQKPWGIIGKNEMLKHYYSSINYLISAIDVNIIKNGLIEAVKTYDSFDLKEDVWKL